MIVMIYVEHVSDPQDLNQYRQQISLDMVPYCTRRVVQMVTLLFLIICRLISFEDVRNYLSHIIYILTFDFFLNFLLFSPSFGRTDG